MQRKKPLPPTVCGALSYTSKNIMIYRSPYGFRFDNGWRSLKVMVLVNKQPLNCTSFKLSLYSLGLHNCVYVKSIRKQYTYNINNIYYKIDNSSINKLFINVWYMYIYFVWIPSTTFRRPTTRMWHGTV